MICIISLKYLLCPNLTDQVVVHPLVLLSVVDHFNRTSKVGNVKRVVGILLGCLKKGGVLDISNSFAIPFDEDDKGRIYGRR